MKFLKKLFHLPSPVELGKSNRTSLPMRGICCKPEDYTWEDWHEDVKALHPIKYFFAITLIDWWVVHISMNIEHFIYWIRSYTTHRYHKLDLRQPHTGTDDDYRYGWIDECHQILLANFTILVNHVNSRNSCKFNFGTTQESLSELREIIDKSNEFEVDVLKAQLRDLEEIDALYQYWTVERKADLKKKYELLRDWSEHRLEDQEKDNTLWDAMNAFDNAFEEKEEEMLIRLIKIRKAMWT